MRKTPATKGRLDLFILICGAIVTTIGALVLLGWAGGWRLLTAVRPDYIPMAPNSALVKPYTLHTMQAMLKTVVIDQEGE
ncbi:MAG: hypothetical protein A2511_06260 [Deltaproteobacteria bacterium RIFOXYD12_FULL_50_9]|nr:MAG: hypothetical protein A2511_06260 [Deltaproteobacteria bacterium RIFOXYD12_FULL_50_9]